MSLALMLPKINATCFPSSPDASSQTWKKRTVIEMKFLKHFALTMMMVGALGLSVSAQKDPKKDPPPKPKPPDVKPGEGKKPAPRPKPTPKKPGMEFAVVFGRERQDWA